MDFLACFEVSNPKDRIYATLCLGIDIRQKVENTIPPSLDYRRNLLDIYSDFILYCIKTTASLDVLFRPWTDGNMLPWKVSWAAPDNTITMPSWVATSDKLPFGYPTYRRHERINSDCFARPAERNVYVADNGKAAYVRRGDPVKHSLLVKGFVALMKCLRAWQMESFRKKGLK